MAEIKWIKITTNMFDDEKIKLIDAMPERDTIHYIWIRLLVQAGKTNANGYIFLNENIPYTEEMLSTIFNRPLNSVRLALQTLSTFGMIETQEDKLIKITNWDKHQNVDGMEKIREQNRLRKQRQRDKEKQLELPEACTDENVSRDMSRDITQQNKNKNKNKKEEIDKENNNTNSTDKMLKLTNIQVFKHFEKCGFGLLSPVILEKIAADIEVYGHEWLMKAAETADENGVHTYNYVRGILERWHSNGGIKSGGAKQHNQKPTGNEGDGLKEQGIGI